MALGNAPPPPDAADGADGGADATAAAAAPSSVAGESEASAPPPSKKPPTKKPLPPSKGGPKPPPPPPTHRPPDVRGLDRALSALRDAFEREGDDLTARALFDRFDGDGDGLLDADEFRVLCQTLVPSFSPAETRFALAHVFERIEADPDEDIMGELAIVHLMKTSPPAHGTIPFVAFEEAIKSLGHRDEE